MPRRNKRDHFRVTERRNRVAKMYLRGIAQYQIAKECGVHPGQISRDIAHLLREWKESSFADIDTKRAVELAKIERLEQTYWEAWERSCGQREISITKRKGAGDSAELEASLRKEDRDGNPRFLEGMRWCIGKRCEILGLVGLPEVSTTELNSQIESLLEKVRAEAKAKGRAEAIEEARRAANQPQRPGEWQSSGTAA
jgi:hypothetical protein